jgi:hypothetical protein
MDSRKDAEFKIDILQAIHLTVVAWQHVTQSTIVNCFRKCDCVPELQTEADLNPNV